MKICVIGTGYVGLVTGVCLADFGNNVTCIDKDIKRTKDLQKSVVPFYEPGLPELLLRNLKARRLWFSHEMKQSVVAAEIIFITVGTPAKENGDADISAVVEVAKGIAATIKSTTNTKAKFPRVNNFKVIVNKSTVPVGMGDVVTKILIKNGVPERVFSVVSNPEFLREGSAIADFFNPDRIIIGASSNRAFNIITELYRPLNAHIIFTDIKTAELVKYASNAFLATKISFINEIAQICERMKVDITQVADAVGLDKRIGRAFLNAGLGYGGSCFPKDIAALTRLATFLGYEPKLINAVNDINELQWKYFVDKVIDILGGVKNKKIGILGVSFKAGTDDIREAPALKIVRALLKQGAKVNIYDPAAERKAVQAVPQAVCHQNIYDAVKEVDAIIVATEWPEFREMDLGKVRRLVKKAYLFDGRNIYNPKRVREAGFKYFGVGRQ